MTEKNSNELLSGQIANSRAVFLTQDGSYSPLKKRTIGDKKQQTQEQKGQLWQLNILCDSLLQEVSQMKTQQVLSLYRQFNRNLSQNLIEKEGDMNKLQKITKIDIQFLKKKLENQPQIDFNFLNHRIDTYEKQALEVSNLLAEFKQRVNKIQKQFW